MEMSWFASTDVDMVPTIVLMPLLLIRLERARSARQQTRSKP